MSNTVITYYEILDIEPSVNQEEIKAAYKRCLRRTHPDTTQAETGHIFNMIQKAYEVLSSPISRAKYDKFLELAGSSSHIIFDDSSTDDMTHPVSDSKEKDVEELLQMGKDLERETIYPSLYSLNSNLFLMMLSLIFLAGGWFIGWRTETLFSPLLWGTAVFVIFGVVNAVFRKRQGFSLPLFFTSLGYMFAAVVQLLQYQNLIKTLVMFCISTAMFCMTLLCQRVVFNRMSRFDLPALLSINAANHKVFGIPGAGLSDALDKFGESRVNDGMTGEQLTGYMLESLLRIPGVRIFHGMSFPGSATADVDHAVICGDKIAFIDSKYWSPGTYTWGQYGEILVDYGSKVSRQSHFSTAIRSYRDILRTDTKEIRGYILIHPKQGEIIGDTNLGPEGILISDPYTILYEIAIWFMQDHNPIVNRETLGRVYAHMR